MITFLEKNHKLRCVSLVSWSTLFFSISHYKYFYNKTILLDGQSYLFEGINLDYYDEHWSEDVEIEEVEVYVGIELNKTLEFKSKSETKVTAQTLLDLFISEYDNKFHIDYVINNKFTYYNKLRQLMDQFYKNELRDIHIKNYIRRCVKFGNYKGDPIYLDFIFNDKVIQNYLLFVKGIKDITMVWPYLDITLSQLEKKHIKYLMNLKLFDDFTDIEKDICCRLYKKYNNKIYEQLLERHKANNKIIAKDEIFNIISTTYGIVMQDLLVKTKHDENYFLYDFTRAQLKEALI